MCPSARSKSAPTRRIFHEILYLNIFRKTAKKIPVSWKSGKYKGHFTWRPIRIFCHISLSLFLSQFFLNKKCCKVVEKMKKHTFFLPSKFYSKTVTFVREYGKILYSRRDHICTRNACWIPKATNTHPEYATLFFQGNDGCTKDPQCHVVCTLPVLLSKIYVKTRAFTPTNIQCDRLEMRANSWQINSRTVFKILTLCVLYFGRQQWPRGLRRGSAYAQVCYDCAFESRQKHTCLRLESVLCCQVELFASGWSKESYRAWSFDNDALAH